MMANHTYITFGSYVNNKFYSPDMYVHLKDSVSLLFF